MKADGKHFNFWAKLICNGTPLKLVLCLLDF